LACHQRFLVRNRHGRNCPAGRPIAINRLSDGPAAVNSAATTMAFAPSTAARPVPAIVRGLAAMGRVVTCSSLSGKSVLELFRTCRVAVGRAAVSPTVPD
jgi:hypothetical protein